jgi:hypothetical protein
MEKKSKYNVAVVGATGAVGRANFPSPNFCRWLLRGRLDSRWISTVKKSPSRS